MDDATTTPRPGPRLAPVPGPPPAARADAAPVDVVPDGPGEVSDTDLAALLAPLEGLEERPVGEHPAAYEQVHGRLRAGLAGEAVTGDAAPQA